MASISASVGYHGVNRPNDVKRVQELINKVPYNLGGPLEPLKVDGICGRKTNNAIQKIQARQKGWNTVTAMVRPGDITWKFLAGYDLSEFIDNSPRPAPPPPSPPPKVQLSRFIITVAASPGSMMNRENFYFMIEDPSNSLNRALYYMGAYPFPPLPASDEWSITKPPYTVTPVPMGVDDWAGEAIINERIVNGARSTRIFFMPTVLNRTILSEIHAHIGPNSGPEGSGVTTQMQFYIVDSSSTHVVK